MADSMFSSSWYRIAGLKPRLRNHVQISRHHYRGQLWYVLQDRSNSQNHRFTPEVYFVLSLMDGARNFQTIWNLTLEQLGDDAPTQDEMVKLLGQLHSSDLLLCDVPPDTLELFHRFEKKQKVKWKQKFSSPLSIRISLWDPDDFLERWLFLVLPFAGWLGKIIWMTVITIAVVLTASNWPDLSKGVADRIMAPSNLLLLFFIYPVVKFFHEMGHAFSAKVWGGEVHEVGIMLLVFMPIPYVDASSAWSFRDRKKRVVVGAAGMGVELFLAALALFVWLSVEQGMVRAIAYNVMLIGGVSTLFFNGNPLLRFDGYYIFSDLIEIPNLSSRANSYIGYLFQRYLFSVQLNSPASGTGEKAWFICYGLASFIYRMLISFTIILFVAGKFFFMGIIFACWAVYSMIVLPVYKQLKFIFTSPVIQRQRLRAITTSFSLMTILLSLLFLFPVSLSSYAEGVVWLPEQAKVRAETEGFVLKVHAQPFSTVQPGDVLLELEDPLLMSRQQILQYRIDELNAQLKAAWIENQVQAQIVKEQIEITKMELAQVNELINKLVLRSPSTGQFVVPRAKDLIGSFFNKGDLAAYIVSFPMTTIRTVVTQDDIGLVRELTQSVQVRLIDNIKMFYDAQIIRVVPAASDMLPSPALGYMGGGLIPVDPSSSEGDKAYEPVFQIELAFPAEANARHLGERVYVRFDFGSEPLAWQWFRLARQLFLRQFSV
jgi:putative peptide zinc metalloprotease protein